MLEVSPSGEDWHLLLRRTDFGADQGFAASHRRELGSMEVARFVPNWRTLTWIPVPDNLLSRSESWALDEPYQVNVRASSASGKRHGDVVAAFIRFMGAPE